MPSALKSPPVKAAVAVNFWSYAIRKAGVELDGRLAIHSVVDEEAGGFGAMDLVKSKRLAKRAIIAEPTWRNIIPAEGGLTWDDATLAAYLTKPKDVIPKGKMSFAGLKKEEDIANVIAFLCSEEAPNGVVLQAQGGQYSVACIVENQGVDLGVDATAEDIGERWEQIADLTGAQPRGMLQLSEV